MTRPATTSITTQSADASIQWERDVAEILRSELSKNEQLLGLFASVLVNGLREKLGGQELRIPAPDKSARNASIRAEFNGRNVRELARKYGISVRMVYLIVQKSVK